VFVQGELEAVDAVRLPHRLETERHPLSPTKKRGDRPRFDEQTLRSLAEVISSLESKTVPIDAESAQ